MKSVKYLLDLQAKKSMTDTALAKALGISQPAVSHYKTGKRVMDDETCLAVALQLEVNPMEVVGAACIDRAEKTGQKSLWEVFMSRTAATAATVLMASSVTLFLTPDAEAAQVKAPFEGKASEYKLCEVNRARRRSRKALVMSKVRDLLRAMSARFERVFMSAALEPATR